MLVDWLVGCRLLLLLLLLLRSLRPIITKSASHSFVGLLEITKLPSDYKMVGLVQILGFPFILSGPVGWDLAQPKSCLLVIQN